MEELFGRIYEEVGLQVPPTAAKEAAGEWKAIKVVLVASSNLSSVEKRSNALCIRHLLDLVKKIRMLSQAFPTRAACRRTPISGVCLCGGRLPTSVLV